MGKTHRMRNAQNGKRTKSEGAIHAKMKNFCPEEHKIGERTKSHNKTAQNGNFCTVCELSTPVKPSLPNAGGEFVGVTVGVTAGITVGVTVDVTASVAAGVAVGARMIEMGCADGVCVLVATLAVGRKMSCGACVGVGMGVGQDAEFYSFHGVFSAKPLGPVCRRGGRWFFFTANG